MAAFFVYRGIDPLISNTSTMIRIDSNNLLSLALVARKIALSGFSILESKILMAGSAGLSKAVKVVVRVVNRLVMSAQLKPTSRFRAIQTRYSSIILADILRVGSNMGANLLTTRRSARGSTFRPERGR